MRRCTASYRAFSGSCTSLSVFLFSDPALSIFYSALCTTAPWLHRVPQSVPGRLDTAHSRAISARRSVFRVFSDIPLSCCLFSFILFFILSHHSGNGNSVLRFFSCSIPLCELYVNRLHIIFFNKFPASSLSFLPFFCLSFTAGQKKTPRFLFSAEFSFRFCFTPNRAPQGSPAWSSHSAPSLPFFSGRYTQWKAPTFPQSADGSS